MRWQDLPHWNYDGSSTGQAPGHDSEVYLIPRSIFKDPFRYGKPSSSVAKSWPLFNVLTSSTRACMRVRNKQLAPRFEHVVFSF